MYDATFKIILFGDVGTGKQELALRFVTNLFISKPKMTIGVDCDVKILTVEDKTVKLEIWVLGGQERFRFLLPTYIRGVHGCMFVYDITKYPTLAHIDDWLSIIRKEAKYPFPMIIVGMNLDLREYREVPAEDAIKIAKSRGFNGFIECSAKTGENVDEAFIALTKLMLDYFKPREIGVRPVTTGKTGIYKVYLANLASSRKATNGKLKHLFNKQVKKRPKDDPEKKIKKILELEKQKKMEESFSQAHKRLQEGTQSKEKHFMDQNLEQWLENLEGLKTGCEEIIQFLRDKKEYYYYHISFEQWKDLLEESSELLGKFNENPSSFYKMSDDIKKKLYKLFEIFIPCREILSNGSFGENVRVSFEEYMKILKLEKKD